MGRSKSRNNYVSQPPSPTIIQDFGPPPPPPSPTEWRDTFDFLTRTKQVTTTGPDGKKRQELHRLPATPEEQEVLDRASQIMRSTLGNITQLAQYNPDDLVDYQELIQAFSEIKNDRIRDIGDTIGVQDFRQEIDEFRRAQSEILDRQHDMQRRQLEAELNARGLTNSSIATERRNALASSQSRDRRLSSIESRKYGTDLAKENFAEKLKRFDVREYGRKQNETYAQGLYDTQRQDFFDREQLRRNALQEQAGLFSIGQGVINNDLNLALQSMAPQMAQTAFNAESAEKQALYNAQLNAFNANVNAQINRTNANNNANNANFYAQLDRHRNKPPSTRQQLFNLGANIGGVATGSMGGGFGNVAGGLLANKLFGNPANQPQTGGNPVGR